MILEVPGTAYILDLAREAQAFVLLFDNDFINVITVLHELVHGTSKLTETVDKRGININILIGEASRNRTLSSVKGDLF